MDGVALGVDDGDDDEYDDDGDNDNGDDDGDGDGNIGVAGDDLFTTACVWADVQATCPADARLDFLRRKIRRLLVLLEHRRRVGYTIDLSFDLGNSSQYDVNDASQAYSCWAVEMLGHG
jgi:hypothetical protein